MITDLDSAVRIFSSEFSGQQTKHLVSRLSLLHRTNTSPGLLAACELIEQLAGDAGLAEVQLHRYPTGGSGFWWTWKKPWAWTPRSATLRLVSPSTEVLARFDDVPCSLGQNCAPTPPGGIEAELVDVGAGLSDADYEGRDVQGKVVLISGTGWNTKLLTKLAAVHGAVGVISDGLVEMPPVRTRENAPEQIGYSRVWTEADGSSIFYFGIDRHTMLRLKELLKGGDAPVRVHALVDSQLGDGVEPVVSGVIRGATKPDEEIVFVAHICHAAPGANDNASGAAMILHLARAWTRLIASGQLPAPERTIRFLWLPEWYGTAAYMSANPEWPFQVKAALCCDMVGEDQQLCGGPLLLERTPDTVPSYLNDLAERILEQMVSGTGSYFGASAPSLWKYQVADYGGGSDHSFFIDSSFRVPALYIGHWPDRFYHSSHDTPDKVDPAELERVAQLTFRMASFLAGTGSSEAILLAEETCERALRRLSSVAQDALWHRSEGSPQDARQCLERAGERLDFRLQIEKDAVASVTALTSSDPEVAGAIEECQAQLTAKADSLRRKLAAALAVAPAREQRDPKSTIEAEMERLVPTRQWVGLLNTDYPAEVLGFDRAAWLTEKTARSLGATVLLRMASLWVDGRRDLLEIARLASLSTGVEPDCELILHFFRDLADAGAITLSESSAAL